MEHRCFSTFLISFPLCSVSFLHASSVIILHFLLLLSKIIIFQMSANLLLLLARILTTWWISSHQNYIFLLYTWHQLQLYGSFFFIIYEFFSYFIYEVLPSYFWFCDTCLQKRNTSVCINNIHIFKMENLFCVPLFSLVHLLALKLRLKEGMALGWNTSRLQ